VYAKVVRQPIGFFQHHPTGRVLSTIINDVERVRNTFSDSLAAGFRHIFTLIFLLGVLLATNWKMTLGSVVLLPMVVWPVRTMGSASGVPRKVSSPHRRVEPDRGGNGQRKPRGEGFRDGRF